MRCPLLTTLLFEAGGLLAGRQWSTGRIVGILLCIHVQLYSTYEGMIVVLYSLLILYV